MDKREINEYVDEKGWIHINALFEVVGNPKEHVQKSLDLALKKIEEEQGIILTRKETEPPEETEGNLYNAYADVDLLLEDTYRLGWVAFNLTPASIELLKPSKLILKDQNFNEFMGDLIARLHETNQKNVDISSKNLGLQRNIGALIRNAALYITKDDYKKPEEIAKPLGLKEEDLKNILEKMVEEGTLEMNNGAYKKAI